MNVRWTPFSNNLVTRDSAGHPEKTRDFLSPLRGLNRFPSVPTACAVGCVLAPLRGLEDPGLDIRSPLGWELTLHEVHRFLASGEMPFELRVFHGGQDFFEARPRFVAGVDQILSSD